MFVKEVKIRNFRNIKEIHFFPDQKINFFIGKNGQGKTSILEAISFLSTLKSFKDSKNYQLIQVNESRSELDCTIVSQEAWETHLKVELEIEDLSDLNFKNLESKTSNQKVKKKAFINNKHCSSSTQYLFQKFGSYPLGFHAINFNPSNHDLIRGNPSIRRTYLDQVLCAEEPEYLKKLQKYQKVLQQRNALLKSEDFSSGLWVTLTQLLGQYGSWITYQRLLWLDRLITELAIVINKIGFFKKQIQFHYISEWAFKNAYFSGQQELFSLEFLDKNFFEKVESLKRMERKLKCSLVGPHRDDWFFLMDQKNLKGYGSQGEVRSILLALKLSEIHLFRKKTGYKPLFLLDDFSSELDQERRDFLLNYLNQEDLQTFITTTDFVHNSLNYPWKCIEVFEGKI